MTSISRSRYDKVDPWQEFDLIGGTSTGGLLAIMLGRLRMSVKDCEKAYSDLSGSLFTPRRDRSDVVNRAIDFLKANGRFDELTLEENIKARIADSGLDENELLEDERPDTCKVFVSATQVHDNSPTLLRSYENRTSFGEVAGVKVWEAARATSAATTFFDPVKIRDHEELFADGALHYNNPIEVVLQEAKDLWPNDEFLLLSIGTGSAPGQPINEGLLSVVEQLKRIATETEQTAQRFLRAHSDLVAASQLFRFYVYHGLGTIGLDESKELAQIAARTRTYLREPEVSWKMSSCVKSFLVASDSQDLKKDIALSVMHDSPKPLQLLKTLEPVEELNILILGETGVGKSTWINAFINYLMFESLDEAILANDLNWVIPCSFATQFMDPSDDKCRFVQRDIKIGPSNGGDYGAEGVSASQSATAYVVNIGNTRVRLIDTPGIGDTREIEQDNQIMADILKALQSYTNLHGVSILLRPNTPRLTLMSSFCIRHLLAHLHRNAANNIVFGFTNARGSNYMPGDTFRPLEQLLDECQEVKIGLFEYNIYCFDSESFRYLAARKKGVDMGMLEENRQSWQHSVQECKRLLKHFKGLKPHQIQDTLDLNETGHIVICLTEPMVQIAQSIQSIIAVNQDNINDLKKTYARYQPRVGKDLTQDATAIELKEMKSEHQQIQAAAIQFSFFLERRSIIPYADGTLEYLDHQINEECMKVSAGGRIEKLRFLQKYRAEHEWRDKVLYESESRGEKNKLLVYNDIRQLLNRLYGLKHFGQNLHNVVTTSGPSTRATYREKAFNVKAGHHWANYWTASRED